MKRSSAREKSSRKKIRTERRGEDRHRAEDRDRRGQIRRSLAIPDDRLHFSWDRMLSFQGNTAPYLQNAYVRIRSIFRKAGEEFSPPNELALTEPAELNLAKRLCQFAEIVPQVLNDFRPNILANYLFELANSFHAFYEACPVLKAEAAARATRLALCELTARTLQRGLDLLGIGVPEKCEAELGHRIKSRRSLSLRPRAERRLAGRKLSAFSCPNEFARPASARRPACRLRRGSCRAGSL